MWGCKNIDNLQEYTISNIEFIDIRMQIWCLRYDEDFAYIDFECNQYKTYFRFVAPMDQKVVSWWARSHHALECVRYQRMEFALGARERLKKLLRQEWMRSNVSIKCSHKFWSYRKVYIDKNNIRSSDKYMHSNFLKK